jgi:hypothetical protein
MNGRQRNALRTHCRLGIETGHPGLRWAERTYTVVLSVNSGYE